MRERSAQDRERDRQERERRRSERRGEPGGLVGPPATSDENVEQSRDADPSAFAGHANDADRLNGAEPAADAPRSAAGSAHLAADASPASVDAGYAPADAGYAPADAGYASADAGYAPDDAGYAPAGAGYEEAAVETAVELPAERAPSTQTRPGVAVPAPSGGQPTPAALAPRRRRSPLARLGALLALAAVIVAVVLLVWPLLRPSHPKPPAPPPAVKVLIPEGKTRAQIAQIAAAAHLLGSYRAASKSSSLLSPARYGAPADTPDLEGFLFPATYEVLVHASASRLVEEQLLAFRERFGARDVARAHALHVTPYQLLIVASMVEREARVAADRPKIAAVIYNRLHRHMPLGVDATLYYEIEQRTGIATYTRELTEAQLQIDSPYNTRTHVGLPPTPISNPGVASIEAAAHPAHVGYLYYVLGADGCGEHVFARTPVEFEVADAAYREALAKHGGHLPACKAK